MNIARSFTHLTMIAAAAAAAFTTQASDLLPATVRLETVVVTGQRLPPASAPAAVQLPTVTVIGKRSDVAAPDVVRLPAVVVTGRRLADPSVVVAEKNARPAPAVKSAG